MENDFDRAVQKQLDAAMPWVGLYIAAASAVCTLAMAADAFNGFRHRKLWIPCKYSSLNAASLTVLAVATKLPMDLNTVMIKSQTDAIAKYMSLSFIFTALNNCMPSLGSMNDDEVVANVAGLALLVITITANIVIQIVELQTFLTPSTIIVEITIPTVLMLLSLVTLVSLAFSVSTMKRSLKRMYMEKHEAAINEEEGSSSTMDDLVYERRVLMMMKYWVMAESSSPQFVIARSVVSTCSSLICFFSYIIITISVQILDGTSTSTNARGQSPYGIYTRWIVIIQSAGEYIAVTVAMLRWFVSVSVVSANTFQLHLKIEAYWIQTLKDWRNLNGLAGFQIGPNRWRRCLVDVKWCVLTLCMGVQSLIIHLSKTLVFFSSFIVTPFLFCFSHIRHTPGGDGDDHDTEARDLSRYALLLEGEAELPARFVKSMCLEADRMIQRGRQNKPSGLINLIRISVNFNGVGRYNNSQIPSLLNSEDPPDCWMLPLVTLTTIAIALPNISQHQRKQLLSSVSEGLSLVKIVEKTLDTSAHLKSIRKVATVTWVQLLLYSTWLGIDLRRECENSEKVLQELSDKAEAMVMEWKSEVRDSDMGNKWPLKVVAANSMYRICQTILLSSRTRREESGEEFWERLSVMIADIMAACFTNLPRAITKMCHHNSIEKREKSVREAFLLLGKTEQVVGLVRQKQRPSIDDGKEAYIEEWRAAYFLQQQKYDETSSSSTSTDESGSEVHLAIVVDS